MEFNNDEVAVQMRGESGSKIASMAVKASLWADGVIGEQLNWDVMNLEEDWPRRVELFAYFLHAADWLAFDAAGPDVRDWLLEPATQIGARLLTELSFGGEWDDWSKQVAEETVEEIASAEEVYGATKVPWPMGPHKMLGTAVAQTQLISRLLGQPKTLDFAEATAISMAVMEAISNERLIEITYEEANVAMAAIGRSTKQNR